ncbi:MAG: hypothetical protein LBC42_03545 [Puniceicoccales bacterium]|jgi:DNA repair protein RadC|nr:hypothetical protein [Puniceicoccales bacterium]
MCAAQKSADGTPEPRKPPPIAPLDGHREHLRIRFDRCGLDGFLPHEIIELLLTFCIPRRDVKLQAKELLRRFESLHGILNADKAALREVDGIGPGVAQFLHLIRETTILYLRQTVLPDSKQGLGSLGKLCRYWLTRLNGERCECLEIAYLDGKFHPIPDGLQRLDSGNWNSVSLLPRKIIRSSLLCNCAAIALCHNHPTGNPLPSQQDEHITYILRQNLQISGVCLVDHFIVANGQVFSILEHRIVLP